MLSIGIIGMGGFGTNLARQVVSHPDARLAAAADVSEATLDAAGERFDLDDAQLFADEREMYAETALDAVAVATPPAFHYEQVLDALDRGLHVLCEKPVVMDTEEARGLLERAEASDRVVMTGYQRHLNPGFVHARERWQSGDREPTFVTGELTQDWTGHFESGDNWRTDPDVAGYGHLFSVGTHVVESVLWLTGLTPETVSAQMVFHDDEQYIDKQAAMTVQFENGATASIGDTATAPATREHIHVWDDEGAVYLDGVDWGRRELTLYDADNDDVTPDVDYDGAPTKIGAFVDAIERGVAPPSTAEDALRVTALLEAAYESARTGGTVDVDL